MKKDYPSMCLFKAPEFLTSDEINEWKSCYSEFREESGDESEFDEYEFDKWMCDEIYRSLEDDRTNMRFSPYANMPCVITGTLGLWNGRPEIEPVRMGDLMDAIDRCICTRYASYSHVELSDGRIEVSVAHHDGTNHFTISLLNQKGANAKDDADLSKECYHKKIKGYLF